VTVTCVPDPPLVEGEAEIGGDGEADVDGEAAVEDGEPPTEPVTLVAVV
jgi:hypothetical protein